MMTSALPFLSTSPSTIDVASHASVPELSLPVAGKSCAVRSTSLPDASPKKMRVDSVRVPTA